MATSLRCSLRCGGEQSRWLAPQWRPRGRSGATCPESATTSACAKVPRRRGGGQAALGIGQHATRGTRGSCACRLPPRPRFSTVVASGNDGERDGGTTPGLGFLGSPAAVREETPWDVRTIVQVVTLWLVGFCLVGGVCIPVVTQWFGFSDTAVLAPTDHWKQALFTVTVDIIEMCVGLGVLRACIRQFEPLRKGFFPFRVRGRWPIAVLLGCCLFPLVQLIANVSEGVRQPAAQSILEWLPREIMQMSPVEVMAQSVYIFWTTCMSPIWEEILFRGFLVPSFDKYLPTILAVVLSAVIFALLHFSMHRILPLTILGCLMGFVFTSTNNLLAPIVLHSLWNVFAFVNAFTYPVV